MRAWLFQDYRQKKRLGEEKCPWSVGWMDPDGKRKSKKIGSRSMAEKFRRRVEGELAAGTYQTESRTKWTKFRAEYEEKIAAGMKRATRRCTLDALSHFERLVKPVKVATIKSQTFDDYKAKRRVEPGKKKGDTVSPATINKELRHLKSVLGVAHEWEYLPKLPKVRMMREPEKIQPDVTPEHFVAMYDACDAATKPKGFPFTPTDWWRALFVFSYMTGWRISEPLALRRDDLDLEGQAAITRAADNKGGRDERMPLHPLVVEHLHRIQCFEPMVFPWYHHERTLYVEFAKIQDGAGIKLPCPDGGRHECTDACHRYGFHGFRYGFATQNDGSVPPNVLQKLMRHKSQKTTQHYINMARKLNGTVDKLFVPPLRKPKAS